MALQNVRSGPGSEREKARSATTDFLLHANLEQAASPLLAALCISTQESAAAHGWQRDDARDILRKEQAEKEVKLQEEQLLAAIQAYQDNAKEKYRTAIVLTRGDNTHSWNQVLSAVEDLRAAKETTTGRWAKLKDCFRVFQDNSILFRQWIELLPTQNEYFSVLCGGLKLVLGAVARLKDVRDTISDALFELPTLLCTVTQDVQVFNNLDLHICSREIMAKTFQVLRFMVRELTRSVIRKGITALMLQGSYASELSGALGGVRALRDRFDRIAQTCAHTTLRSIEQNTQEHMAQNTTEHIMTRQHVTGHFTKLVQDVTASFSRELDARDERLVAQVTLLNKNATLFLEAQSQVFKFLQDTIDKRQPLLEAPPQDPLREISRWQTRNARRAKRRTDMLEALGHDAQLLAEELDAHLNSLWAAGCDAHSRAHYIVGQQQLLAWLVNPLFNIILIIGNSSAAQRGSATTYISASIVRTVTAAAPSEGDDDCRSTVLSFFCNGRMRSGDNNPLAMIRSLTAQLLAFNESLVVPKSLTPTSLESSRDVQSLWDFFEALIAQLHHDVLVYCVLDDIAEYEFSNWGEEVLHIVHRLIDLTRRLSTNRDACTIKLLLTTSTSTHTLDRDLEESEVLYIPERVPATGDFADSEWMLNADRRAG